MDDHLRLHLPQPTTTCNHTYHNSSQTTSSHDKLQSGLQNSNKSWNFPIKWVKGRGVGFAIILNCDKQGTECIAFAKRGSPDACSSPHAERSQQGRRLEDWGRSSQKRVKPLFIKRPRVVKILYTETSLGYYTPWAVPEICPLFE